MATTSDPARQSTAEGTPRWAGATGLERTFKILAARLRSWLGEPKNARRAVGVGAVVVLALGLLLPPVELGTRLTSFGYTPLRPGRDAHVVSSPPGAALDAFRHDIVRAGRLRLSGSSALPGGLPEGHELLGSVYRLDLKGAGPKSATLSVRADVPDEEQAFVDPYGWDGRRWRWLPVSFPSSGVARIDLQPDTFMPLAVALTRATAGATQVAAVLLPPPNTVPAAVAELPILEMRAFHLESDDGSVAGSVFPVPARPEGRYAVIDNLESNRTRYDLITNILSRPESRENHRRAIVGIARDASLAGVVLDYRGVPGDLMPLYADWLTRLNHDLDHVGADLIVTVPMPRGEADQWDPSPYTWRPLGAAVDGLRVLLPDDKPPGIADLDGMVRWALQSVERQKLQLSVTARGRDILDDPGVTEVKPIGFGEALAKILDMAEADAPRRLSPAESATVELRTVAVSGLSRDPTTSQWQFAYWDGSRRPHTVWLNDASGLKPAFDIAARYRLGRLDLDGVSAGLDPSLWQLVQTFRDEGRAELDPKAYAYQLDWQLLDDTGAVVREAVQPVDATTFQFRAPEAEGSYRLSVDLVDGNGRLVAPGSTVPVTVGPPPLPTPSPTPLVVLIAPTPENPVTMPPPSDELAIHRDPILANVTAQAVVSDVYDASVIMPDSVLRAGPSTQTAVAGDIDVGDRLDVMGRSSDARWYWVRVAATGVTGWAYADVIELRVDGGSVPEILEPTPTP